ncbi:conserved hypothetical protein [Histoplasma capsulatum G186AR]|uniref:GYF domain-containing protein n=1 Tax=Ajellomyces capsulatus (strain G186AR / H82 / ATCC MYA-2454 / RMSCC 2432) TaxID=447093 RepID=C0P058_AJECG|nr:uncharacterized protein HCBG_08777 [Histoplasma capsulatum G186AR]EEH02874.1 conserved hypothetical protein [Histoplasma capsulatum G186AR]
MAVRYSLLQESAMASISGRPKRAGEDFIPTNHNNADSDENGPTSSKRVRFDPRNPSALAPDALEEDAVLDADEIGHRGRRVRRNAVNIEGYDSDSDNGGFDARVEAKSRANMKNASGDTDDMFAELEEDFATGRSDDVTTPGNKKQVRFLQDDEIEGQVHDSRAGGTVTLDLDSHGKMIQVSLGEEGESESEVDEQERARVGSDMPSICERSRREGRFDEAGNFVRKAADPDAIHDTWLEGQKPKWQNRNRNRQRGSKNGTEDEEMGEDDPAEIARKRVIEDVTGAADILLSRGQSEIYDTERELLMRQYKRETGEDWVDSARAEDAPSKIETDASPLWEYRWSDLRDGGAAHGPYDGAMMESWHAAGYFGEGVEFRKVGTTGEWSSRASFT